MWILFKSEDVSQNMKDIYTSWAAAVGVDLNLPMQAEETYKQGPFKVCLPSVGTTYVDKSCFTVLSDNFLDTPLEEFL